ncbi:MAG: flavodoxin family protein [Eubacteriaceae bacterium]|nr:flavodoxin family protein [Eubacteriaceae bacterium]
MRKGNTYALTKEIIDRLLSKPDIEIVEYSVAGLNLPFCLSCHNCFMKGEEFCPHYAILKDISLKMAECDGVIFSGVAYMWALNGAMKNFLDHYAYLFHRPALFGKIGMVISTSAGVGEKAVTKYMRSVLGQWGINGAIAVTANAKQKDLDPPKKLAAKLDSAAERYYHMLLKKKPIAPSIKNLAIHNAFRAISLSEFSGSELDTQYWSQKGFANSTYPTKLSVARNIIGSVIHGVVKHSAKALDKAYKNNQRQTGNT